MAIEKLSRKELSIAELALEDRPREKLLNKGITALTEAELIAILIGSGTAEMNAIDLSKVILSSVGNDLNEIAKLGVKDLMKFKGIGEAKAINIISALELGRRRKDSSTPRREKITSSEDVYKLIKPLLMDLRHEEFWILLLNRANVVIKKNQISQGGVSGTLVDPKLVFKSALEHLASSIILVHNHPSGNLSASQADIKLTEKISNAGKLLEIPVLDHVIVSDQGYFSFADQGLL